MERLGIYIFIFFFLGIGFFERVRTHSDTGSIWRVVFRNLGVLALAATGYFLFGYDLMFQAAHDRQLFGTVRAFFDQDPYNKSIPGAGLAKFMQLWLDCLFCATATLIVASGIWELRVRAWAKWLTVAFFILLVYPFFGFLEGDSGYLGRNGFYDHALALGVFGLPSAFVLGIRLLVPVDALPGNREHHLKGYKILPGMKHRFFFSRGIGFMMVFLILSAQTLVNLPFQFDNPKILWVISKTLTLIPASFTILFSNFLFYGLFGRKGIGRTTHAPPIFAVMTALVATQACNQYGVQEAVISAVAATFAGLFSLRILPLSNRFWDPLCSLPIFLLGGSVGIIMASLTPAAKLVTQATGVAVCLGLGLGLGALFSLMIRLLPIQDLVAKIDEEDEASAPQSEPLVAEDTEASSGKEKRFGRRKRREN